MSASQLLLTTPSRRALRRLLPMTGCALAVGLGLSAPASAAAAVTAPPASQAVALQGAAYLAAQVAGTGFVSSHGAPDYGDTADIVIALHAAGVGGTAAALAEAYDRTHAVAGGYGGDGTAAGDDPGQLATLILAAVDEGDNPRAYGGALPIDDLVTRLLATQGQHTAGGAQDAGLFGAADPTYDGAFREGLSLAALKAAAAPVNVAGVGWLSAQQCSDGGWESYRPSEATPCSDADPAGGEDTNSTALAVEGLVAQGTTPAAATLTFLHAAQAATGGFGYSPGSSSDPDSDGVVTQALVALGQDPSSMAWTQGGGTPYTDLASFQLGCATATPGAFFYPAGAGQPETANLLATEQAVPGAAAQPFPVPAGDLTPTAPLHCTVASPTPTASATVISVSSTPTAVASPTTSVLGITQTKGPTLPFTGTTAVPGLTVAGVGLLAGGLVLLRVSRRRSPGRHQA